MQPELWTSELYRFDPDTYWETRGGAKYLASMKESHSLADEQQRKFFRMILDRFGPRTLLDFGFGTGRLFDMWSEVWQVYGIERSHSQFEYAKTREFNYRLVLNSSRSTIPFENDMFDVIVACEVLNHVLPAELPQLLEDFSRALRDKGVLALVLAPPDHEFQFHSFNHDFRNLLNIAGFVIADDYILPENKMGTTGHSRYRYVVARNVQRKPLTDRRYYPHLFAGEGNGQGTITETVRRLIGVQEDGAVQASSEDAPG